MVRKFFSVFFFFFLFNPLFSVFAASPDEGEKSAITLQYNALNKGNALESVEYLKTHIGLAANDTERRSILYFTATLLEQMGDYSRASLYYAEAAAIDADDARGMPKVTNQELYLYAALSSLEANDCEHADEYLDRLSSFTNLDDITMAKKRLYSAWCSLCKATDYEDAKPIIVLLKSFSEDEKMECVKSQVLFTLWFVTMEKEWEKKIKKSFPNSPETAIVEGKSSMMGMPFWYLMPRASLKNSVEVTQVDNSKIDHGVSASENVSSSVDTVKKEEKSPVKKKRQQLGLYRNEDNAKKLVTKALENGFKAYYYSEVRASGNEYYIVVVDENDDYTMGEKLKKKGFDCYLTE